MRKGEHIITGRVARRIFARWQLYLLLLGPAVYVFVFKYMPMYGIQIAFRQYTFSEGINASAWVGLKWFRIFFGSPQLVRLLRNTVSISLYQLFAGIVPPVVLAIAINEMRNHHMAKAVQLISYMPHFLSVVVITSIIQQVLSLNGLVNNILGNIGVDRIQFLGKPGLFSHIYVWSGIWQHAGYNAIIYIAALAGISVETREAAVVDGANIWQRIWHVDIPGIFPTIVVLMILGSAQILSVGFEKVFLLQNPLNMRTSDVISTYVYRVGMTNMEYSLASAVGLFQSMVSLLMMAIVNAASRRLTESSLW